MERLRTSDVAAALGEPEYAVRTLANRYVFYIPSVRIGEERYFSPESVDVFRLIFKQLAVGVRDEYIELLLGRRYPIAEVAVGAAGTAGWSAFHTGRSGMAPPSAGDGYNPEPAPLALPELAASHQAPSMSAEQPDVDGETLLRQARAMQQRVEALERRIRELETPAPPPVAPHRPAVDGAPGRLIPPRRSFEDLASRDSMAGD